MTLKYFDNFLIAIMAITSMVCLYALYGHKLDNRTSTNQLEIAKIVDQINTVKKKRLFYSSWTEANSGESLLNDD